MGIPIEEILIQTVNGIVTGMILALVASGLTLIFGIMDIVNFAHGELFMLGAYVGVVVMAATGNFWVALLGASGSYAEYDEHHGRHFQHVLLISIDGMHALDFINCAEGISGVNGGAPYCPNLAELAESS